jgi:hypothetical protein
VAQHAAVLLVDLLTGAAESETAQVDPAVLTGRAERLLDQALAELKRAETIELP